MIYITGDTHIPIDIRKLSSSKFKEQKDMTKNDYVIICGDFGGVWDNSNEELYWRKWLQKKNFTTLFVDGNHENHELLNSFEVHSWNGGKVHFINDSIIHLMRGQIFMIDGIKIFTMGGAESIDKQFRVEGKSWWKQEMPSYIEYEEGLMNLEKHNFDVDYIITHTCSTRTFNELQKYSIGLQKYETAIEKYFDEIESQVKFKKWYFGHFHDNGEIDDKHTVLYNNIILLL